ncbi:nitrogen regulatory protein P-II-like protein [Senna tora]|uniref:Nitrogen regulatory protein P-II-like protein n=1 Tax=Senna tora TaxID=362788 RepID=A0A834SID8_9FABA|nr:nitrogen regulatory protein P-II-like protein [Senna tora]
MATIARPHLLRPLKRNELTFSGSSCCPVPKYFGGSQFFHRNRNVALTHKQNATILPKIRAQNSLDYYPDSKFYKVEAILRPWRLPQVSSALLNMGIRGVTVSDVKGFGAQGGSKERQGGSEFSEDKFVAKVKMEIVVSKDQVEAVIDTIIDVARTGEIGDGKIFLVPVADVIRVRTGERGEKAEKMTGGRADLHSSV